MSMLIRLGTCVSMIVLCSTHQGIASCQGCPQKPLRSDPMCGPVALKACLAYYGVDLGLEELKAACGYDGKRGTSLEGLCKAAEGAGLHARALKVSANELLALDIPFIAHYCFNHYVAVIPLEGGRRLRVSDSSSGDRMYDRASFPMSGFKDVYTGYAVAITDDESKVHSTQTPGPDLRLDNHVWTFGVVRYGEGVEHVFKIRNVGSTELVVKGAAPSCGCITTVLPREAIAPGEQGGVKISFDGSKTGVVQERVKLYSNDPVVPATTIVAEGYVKPPKLADSPVLLDFVGPVLRGASAQRKLFLPQYPDESISIRNIRASSPFLETTVEKVAEEGHRGYNIVFTVRKDAPVGKLSSKVLVETTHYAQSVVEVIVTAEVVGDVMARPGQVYFPATASGVEQHSTLTLYTTGKLPLRVERVTPNMAYVSVDLTRRANGKEYTLDATLRGGAPVGNIRGEVVVHTNRSDQPDLRLPVFAYVTPRPDTGASGGARE